MIKTAIRNKRGSTYIDVVIGILISIMVMVLIMKVVPCLIIKNQLNTFATNVSRVIAVEGCYNHEVMEKIEKYKESCGVGDIDITLEGTQFISGTERIQLSDLIVVTVSTDYDLGFSNFGSFRITLRNKAQARSEVYWK